MSLLNISLFYVPCGLMITKMTKYWFIQVLYGLAPTQVLLNAVIRKQVAGYNVFDFVKMVTKVCYVDNITVSVADTNKGIKFYQKCKIHFSGSFNLQKFRTNAIRFKTSPYCKRWNLTLKSREKTMVKSWDVDNYMLWRFSEKLTLHRL